MNSSYPKDLFFKFVCLFFLISTVAYASKFDENLTSNTLPFKFQDSVYHTEKVYLHFDKPYYSSGEMMWFKTYLVSADTNKPDAKSNIVHVELIDSENKILDSRVIKISEGGGEGEFYLPKRLSTGKYTVRAYTNFMRNFNQTYFFTKNINIRSEKSLANDEVQGYDLQGLNNFTENEIKQTVDKLKPDIQFFPEGGYMVTNKTSVIGFKAIGIDGKSISVSGKILDADNNEISVFKTQKFGLGKFDLTPLAYKSYTAVVEYDNNSYTYKLPKALDKGVTMEVIEYENEYQVILRSSLRRGVHRLTLTGLQNGTIAIVSQLTGNYKSGLIKVPKEFLKQGVIQLTVSDKTQKSLCERLVFIQTDLLEPKVSVSSAKTTYKKRELVELNFDLDTIEQANLSLAVTDMSVVNREQNGPDIKSYLLLNSELKGEIEQPNYYFDEKNDDRKQLLDLLMMTQGWRQFLWNNTDQNEILQNNKEFTHETGVSIKGIIKNISGNKKPTSAEVSLTYINKNEFVEDKMRSFNNGEFIFGDYQFNDSTSIIIQAKNYKIRKRKKKADIKKLVRSYNILLDTFKPHTIIRESLYSNNSVNNKGFINNDYMIRSKMVRLNSVIPFDDDVEKLDEATVTSYVRPKEKEKFKNRSIIYGRPTRRVDFDDIQSFGSNNVLAAMRSRVAGLRLVGNISNPISYRDGSGNLITNYRVLYRGSSPLILVDNFEIGDDFSHIYAEDVSFVDFLSPIKASIIFGSRAAGGAISIHTKRGNERVTDYKKNRRGIINFIHPGYYKARKFYEPNYSVKKPEHSKFDYRTTIYWKPTIIPNNNENTRVSFYAADIPTTYRVDLQGISKNGFPIKKEMYIDVK